jgi:hypothetical protein
VKTGTFQVEGVEYRWSVYRQPKWTSQGPVGMAILVKPIAPGTRELLLEFALKYGSGHHCMLSHQRFRVSNSRLIQCIQNAMNAGWTPNRRGKRFVFDAGFPDEYTRK